MPARFEPVSGQARFFAVDGSGVAFLCELTGDTHFLHVDPVGFSKIMSGPPFNLAELLETLNLGGDSEASQFADQLVSLGIIDRIG
ncbi:MAG: hypothetical protein R3F41_15410 [Gammaproteobacteria bacterium]|nr:hypothetical protein [Planctomycetaceae bacterium]MCP5346841.1 hypothetical protein [Pseudomonadales bacterium]